MVQWGPSACRAWRHVETGDGGEARHVRADFGDDGHRGGDVHAVDAREVHTAHLEQLRAHKVERAQRLLECEEVLGAPIALQALGDLVDAGAHAHVLYRAQHLGVALAGDDGAQDLLAGLADHVGQDVGELDVHLRESLLHVLHMQKALAAQQHTALAVQRTQHAHLLGWPERPEQQAVGHELLQPLAVQHVGLAPGHVLDVARGPGQKSRVNESLWTTLNRGKVTNPMPFTRWTFDLR